MEPLKRYDIQAVDWTECVGLEIAQCDTGEWMKADEVIARIDELVEALINEQRRTWQADVYDAYLNACAARIAELETKLSSVTADRDGLERELLALDGNAT